MKKRLLIGLLLFFSSQVAVILKADIPTFDSQSILISPQNVKVGDVVRILMVFEEDLTGLEIETVSPQGVLNPLQKRRSGGFPSWIFMTYNIPSEGVYRIELKREGETVSSASFDVDSKKILRNESPSIWNTRRQWSREVENLYSAWLEFLFLEDEEGAFWENLQEVTSDSKRNLLYNHLNLDEDEKLVMKPDCADNPYFLRAYFSWKLGLPFGFHMCDWGGRLGVPLCTQWVSNRENS